MKCIAKGVRDWHKTTMILLKPLCLWESNKKELDHCWLNGKWRNWFEKVQIKEEVNFTHNHWTTRGKLTEFVYKGGFLKTKRKV